MDMRPGGIWRLIIALAAVALLLPAPWASRDAAAQAATGQPYKIGVTYPLSGPRAAWGLLLLPNAEIAVQQINTAGGVNGRPLELVIEDTKGNPEGAVSAMRKVVQIDRVAAIVSIFTNVVSAQMPLADQLKVPVVSTVEAPGLVGKSEWAFAHGLFLSRTIPAVAERWKTQGVKRICGLKYDTVAAKKLIDAYRAKMGFDPDYAGLEVYDIIHMIAQAIKANGYNGDAIRRGLTEIKDFRSIGGVLVTMGKDRQSIVPIALYQVKDAAKPTFVEIAT